MGRGLQTSTKSSVATRASIAQTDYSFPSREQIFIAIDDEISSLREMGEKEATSEMDRLLLLQKELKDLPEQEAAAVWNVLLLTRSWSEHDHLWGQGRENLLEDWQQKDLAYLRDHHPALLALVGEGSYQRELHELSDSGKIRSLRARRLTHLALLGRLEPLAKKHLPQQFLKNFNKLKSEAAQLVENVEQEIPQSDRNRGVELRVMVALIASYALDKNSHQHKLDEAKEKLAGYLPRREVHLRILPKALLREVSNSNSIGQYHAYLKTVITTEDEELDHVLMHETVHSQQDAFDLDFGHAFASKKVLKEYVDERNINFIEGMTELSTHYLLDRPLHGGILPYASDVFATQVLQDIYQKDDQEMIAASLKDSSAAAFIESMSGKYDADADAIFNAIKRELKQSLIEINEKKPPHQQQDFSKTTPRFSKEDLLMIQAKQKEIAKTIKAKLQSKGLL
jgi:hypothetical protein